MKKFSEFLGENMHEGDHPESHDHALTVGRRFKAHYDHNPDDDENHSHLGAIEPKDVEKHGKALVKAGFTKHEGSDHAPSHGLGTRDSTGYHKYTKGNTTVHVASKPNTWGHNLMKDNRQDSHHHVEIHTPRLHEEAKVVVAEAVSAEAHREAVHIGGSHSANHVHTHGEHSGDTFDGHMGQIHPLDVHRHGKALEDAGFKYHGKGHADMGAHANDHGEYHSYSKGTTKVHVSVKPNVPGTTGHEDDETHHHVEVVTDR